MIEFIPIEYYTTVYLNIMLLFTLVIFLRAYQFKLADSVNLKSHSFYEVFLLVFVTLYMGFRPVSYEFGDMGTYAKLYDDFQNYGFMETQGDPLFYFFMKSCSKIFPVEVFFLICAALYIIPLYYASKKLFGEYSFYAFFMLIASLSFWAYGTNGIRNGLATSFFLLAITRNSRAVKIALFVLALGVHQSMLIPLVMYIFTSFYKNTKYIFLFWLLCIPLSLILGKQLESFFLSLGFGDADKIQGYFVEDEEILEEFSAIGFRWDFLLYSISGVFTGLYFIFKKEFEDEFYRHIINLYLMTNAFWILVIRANFSNRFAYLSWFLLGVVIIYPFLKRMFFKEQHQILGKIILAYFLFTYVLMIFTA